MRTLGTFLHRGRFEIPDGLLDGTLAQIRRGAHGANLHLGREDARRLRRERSAPPPRDARQHRELARLAADGVQRLEVARSDVGEIPRPGRGQRAQRRRWRYVDRDDDIRDRLARMIEFTQLARDLGSPRLPPPESEGSPLAGVLANAEIEHARRRRVGRELEIDATIGADARFDGAVAAYRERRRRLEDDNRVATMFLQPLVGPAYGDRPRPNAPCCAQRLTIFPRVSSHSLPPSSSCNRLCPTRRALCSTEVRPASSTTLRQFAVDLVSAASSVPLATSPNSLPLSVVPPSPCATNLSCSTLGRASRRNSGIPEGCRSISHNSRCSASINGAD